MRRPPAGTGIKIVIVLLGIVVGVGAILIWLPRRAAPPRVTIFDPRLKILWARAVKGTNTYYLPARGNVLGGEGLGSRVEGELRREISRLGVRIETLPAFTPGTNSSGRAFLVSYAFPDPPTSSVHLVAALVDQKGTQYLLRSVAGGGGGPPERSWDLWTLDCLPLAVRGYTLRLTLQTNGPPVAEMKFPDE